MKQLLYKVFTALSVCLVLSSCAEEVFDNIGGRSGEKVTLKLDVQQLTPKIIVNTRATYTENALNNLQIFVFDGSGDNAKLKGYRYITHNASASDDTNLDQNGNAKEVTIKTTTGTSTIYAVANVPTAIYKINNNNKNMPTSESTTEWTEEDAQNGDIDFTLGDLKAIEFNRNQGQFDITEANFMMSGYYDDGKECTIIEDSNGNASILGNTDPIIKLYRVVSKISFTIKNVSSNGNESDITFTPTSYEFCNVPQVGALIKGANVAASGFESTGELHYTTQATNSFNLYLPENLQECTSTSINSWNDREADTQTGDKEFTNAPANATYVVLKGRYSSTFNKNQATEYKRSADVTYYIHLGDFGTPTSPKDNMDFNVERNYHYTYTVTVQGVNSIVVEAKKEADYQYGAEGVVLDTSNGKMFTLDSHYEQVNMTFSQSEIQTLANAGKGYMFQVHDLDGTSNIITVTGSTVEENIEGLNGTHYDWVEFVDGKNQFYPASGKKGLIAVLKEMYDNRNDNSFWTSGEKTYTCFINENYYADRKWSEYCNISPRTLYIANDVTLSEDGRSTYLTLKYGLSQYSIQTFYNKNKAESVIAYGCETMRDDNRKWYGSSSSECGFDHEASTVTLSTSTASSGSDTWDGLANMKNDITSSWSTISYSQARMACMSRNRDLNGDGQISSDEVRWYVPSVNQYGGMWIGENAINEVQARLYLGDTKSLDDPDDNWRNRTGAEHYFTNTNSATVFWAEEGMATGNEYSSDQKLKYVRCIRNLQSNGTGTDKTANTYYDYKNNVIDLTNVDESALRTTYQTNELLEHNEREATVSNARSKFTVAAYSIAKDDYTMVNAVTDQATLCSNYNTESGTWRAPNQRELCMIYMVGAFDNWSGAYGCRTKFSGVTTTYNDDGTIKSESGLRYSWQYQSNINMSNWTNHDSAIIKLRCVKDAQ